MSEHDHRDYAATSPVICETCGKNWEVCAYCNESWHNCMKSTEGKIPRGFRVIPEFPEYMVNSQCTVRHIISGRYCMLVRVSKQGGAMITVYKNNKAYTRAAQELRSQAFDEQIPTPTPQGE